MKEKTKQILRYVACGLGGLALGIGLLGGLSMCATSGSKTTESVNTILTKTPKGEAITTTNGNYSGYSFSVWSQFYNDGITIERNMMKAYIYEVDTSTFTPSLYGSYTINSMGWTSSGVKEAVNILYNRFKPSGDNIRFLACYFNMTWNDNIYGNGEYFTFMFPEENTWSATQLPFMYTNLTGTYTIENLNSNRTISSVSDFYIMPNGSLNQTYLWMADNKGPEYPTFQDAPSYYKEIGYTAGHTNGYSEGYDDAYAEKDSGIAFTSCGVYPNAQVTLATDETIGNFKYMYLCHYITKPGYDEHTIYILWTTHSTTGQYLGQVIDRNDSNSYSPAVTLGSFSEEPTSSVTITATQDMEFGLWVGYITTFHNRGEVTNSILWFGGGTAESDKQIYQNGYDEGWQHGNQTGQETGYQEGYERGLDVGDAEGYSRGYTEGFNQTNTKNVFSLFTSAFDSVASFFDLKIFGFLPLYWFFLAPLFIALISLLMRMVKH